jgi:hypothetical protein
MKFLWTLVAAVVCVCASSQIASAAQMALKLDGDPESFFEVPDHPSLDRDLGSVFTVEAWVNPAKVLGDDEFPNEYMILNKEDVYEISVRNNDPFSEGTFQVAVQPDEAGWVWMDSEALVPPNTWTHVAATWDGMTVRTFVNGKFQQEYELTGPDGDKGILNDTDDSLKVGRRVRGHADLHSIFSGLIDEIRISKVIRYTGDGYTVPAKAFTPDADTVALYHFDEVVDGMVKDASPAGNHGVLRKNAVLVPVTNGPISDTP